MKMLAKDIKFDCRYFDGSKPCQFKTLCKGCNCYQPEGKRILIIKLASVGDVLRTTVLLPALKEKYPQSYVTWLVKEPAQELLETNPHIGRVLVYCLESVLLLQVEKFDLVISLDKAVEAVSLASLIAAKEKYGFGLNKQGKIYPFNREAEYSFTIGLDDELKFFKNKKTYQEMIFEVVKLGYDNDEYELKLAREEFDFADRFFKENNLTSDDVIIGINTGAGKIFANKNLGSTQIVELIELLDKKIKAKILLLGGPAEKELNERVVKEAGCEIVNSGGRHSLKQFSALVNKCAIVITADTLCLHIAIALRRPVVALFGPTCHQEIDLYDRGCKILAEIDCAPCYKLSCEKHPNCMDRIKPEDIVKAAKDLIQEMQNECAKMQNRIREKETRIILKVNKA
ncbi:MAG: glycosyltransferase family 9 protein [Candidatus Omnitrophica bacterium]|nr:glycosyltransferase family 9 protein [Candidatus Omnitrophota bacterium]